MNDNAADALRRRAMWIVRLNVLLLAPGFLACLIGVASMLDPNPLTLWCEQWGWVLLFGGAAGAAIVQLSGRWSFRCPACRFRFARAGASTVHFLLRSSLLRFCPHCGADLRETRARR